MQTQQSGIIPFTTADLQSAGAVYQTAVAYAAKYTQKQAELLAKAAANGAKLPKELDDELMNWQVSAKKAVKAVEEQRKPFTEKAHAFVKAFTAIENTIGKELYEPIQAVRDVSAKIHAEEAAEAARKEAEELAKKQRRIEDIANLETQLRNGYAAYLSTVKQTMLAVYSGANLENINEAESSLQGFIGGILSEEAWSSIALVGDAELIEEVRTQERFDACSAHFTREITAYAEYLVSLLPQRREELERGEKESKAAAELAKKQAEEAEAARIEAQKRAEQESAKAKQQEEVRVLVNQANRKEEAPRAVESYSVTVGSVDGWRAIIDYYLTNSAVSAEDLGKVKLDSMRIFAERSAKSTGEMVSHADVAYEPKYKAVARATKKKVA